MIQDRRRRLVFVYLDGGRFLVQPAARTRRGAWVADGDVVVVTSCAGAELGRAVLGALAASRMDVPHPVGRAHWDVLRQLLKAAGVRSYMAFTRFARLVTVEDDGALHLVPHRSVPVGFERLDAATLCLTQVDAAQITRALVSLFRQLR